jgi:hypothetical protein
MTLAAGLGIPATASAVEIGEARLKAALLMNLALFIDWPDSSGPLQICVAGRGQTVEARRAIERRQVRGRALEVQLVAAPGAVAGLGCHMLFIAASTGARAIEYAQAAAGNATAIVSEDRGLPLERTHVLLALVDDQPVIEINLTAARRSGLGISSRMLKLARQII